MSNIQKKLPDGWKQVRLGSICEFVGGMQPPKYTFKYNPEPGYIRLVQIQDFRRNDAAVYIPEEEGKRRFCEDDVMIGRYGPPVFQILRGLSGSYNVALMKAVPNEDALTKDFLYYLLQEPGIQNAVIAQSQRSAGQSGVQKEFLEDYMVFIPPLEVQKRIASILKEQLAEVEKARASAIKQLEASNRLPDAYLKRVFYGEEAKIGEIKLLGDVCEINPKRTSLQQIDDITPTSFVPMPAVNAQTGTITAMETKQFSDVKKGYTYFEENDVLFAKITPCMQNGKHAIAKGLLNGFGFGSTEFHVIRPGKSVIAEWIHYFIRQTKVLNDAVTHFSGAVGQQRVPDDYLRELEIPLPSLEEQKRITSILNEQRAEIEKVISLVKKQLEVINNLPTTILRKAFSGQI